MSTDGPAGTRMARPAGKRAAAVEPPAPSEVARDPDAPKGSPWQPDKLLQSRVLFLVANSSQAPVNAEAEERVISDVLTAGPCKFHFEKVPDVRVDDLFRVLKDKKPHIVHFSGHGTGDDGLAMKNREGRPTTITARELKLIVQDLAKQGVHLRCVVLNACLAEPQATALAPWVDFVVGTAAVVGDDTAVTFAATFYRALAEGRDPRAAFEAGRARCGGDQAGSERIFRLFYSNPVPAKRKVWPVLLAALLVAGIAAAIAFWPKDETPIVTDAEVAVVDAAMRPVDAAPKPVDAAPKVVDAAPKPVDAAPPPKVRVAPRTVACGRDLKEGFTAKLSSSCRCVGARPATASQLSSAKAAMGCTDLKLCDHLEGSCP
ncbi:MAG: CHAT domain-containing protein [Myxococcales bacterium]|nr:CHAT domain-containing protein [Myxococcales bacterium]